MAEKEETQNENKRKISKEAVKTIGVNAVNLVLVVATVILASRMPSKAEEVKALRSLIIAAQQTSDIAVLKADIDNNTQKIAYLKSLFADDGSFLDFFKEVDSLTQEGIITNVSVGSGTEKDRTGNFGVKIVLEFKGNREQVNGALERISSLPFLVRPLRAEIKYNPEDGSIELTYSAYLYDRQSIE